MRPLLRPELLHLCLEAYRLDVAEEPWLDNVGRTTAAALTGSDEAPVMIFNFERDPETDFPVQLELRHQGAVDWLLASQERIYGALTAPLVSALFPRAPNVGYCVEQARGQGLPDEEVPQAGDIAAAGYTDVFGVLAFNPDGSGTAISLPVHERTQAPDFIESWRRAAIHLAAASRLRRRLRDVPGGWEAEAVAIFERDGKLVHRDEEADTSTLRALVEAHHPRRRSDVDPMKALALWRGLLDGRYTLVEHADVDDHLYLVLLENDAEAHLPTNLSRRERQVVTYAAFGHDNATIAYTLGLSGSTVGSHLSNAMSKLGMPSRAQLIVTFHQLCLQRLLDGTGATSA